MHVQIELHAAADLVVGARRLRLDTGQLLALENFDGRWKFDFERSDLFHHRRRISLSRLDRLRFLATRHTGDEAINVPDKLPDFFSRREDFDFFLKLQRASSEKWIPFLLSEERKTRKQSWRRAPY